MKTSTATASTRWRKSSTSTEFQACVELATWRKTEASNGGAACVELAICDCDEPRLGVRDSKQPSGGYLDLPDAARRALLAYARRF